MPLVLAGATSGSATVQATDAQTVTLTLPATSGTLAVGGTTPTFTSLTVTNDASISGLTVGKGGGSGSSNTVVGNGALAASASDGFMTSVGYLSLAANTTGLYATGIGAYALKANTTGTDNTALGTQALDTNTTGSFNTGLGRFALHSNTTASSNTAVGYQTLYSNSTGTGLTAIGYGAGYASTANNGTYLGWYSGFGVTGAGNTLVGGAAGYGSVNLTTGTYNTLVGYGASTNGAGDTASIVIGSTNSTTGLVGKGSNTGFISPNGGGVYQGNNSAAWSITSDARLKKNIVDNTTGLDAISQIQVRNFEYRTADEVTELAPQNAIDIKGVQLGAIAQELKEILPDCVKTESTGVMSVDASNITWHLVNAIKELNAKVTALEAQLAAK